MDADAIYLDARGVFVETELPGFHILVREDEVPLYRVWRAAFDAAQAIDREAGIDGTPAWPSLAYYVGLARPRLRIEWSGRSHP